MKVYEEMDFQDFDFWGGAQATVNALTDEQAETIWNLLEEMNEGEPLSRIEINDFFWFETDFIAETLGFEDFEALLQHNEVD